MNRDRMYYSWTNDGQKLWKLLCICSEQIEFRKDEIVAFETTQNALNRGRAVQGEWARSKFDLNHLWRSALSSSGNPPFDQLLRSFGKKKAV